MTHKLRFTWNGKMRYVTFLHKVLFPLRIKDIALKREKKDEIEIFNFDFLEV